jgi:predicted AAA+ superfamily ATPase
MACAIAKRYGFWRLRPPKTILLGKCNRQKPHFLANLTYLWHMASDPDLSRTIAETNLWWRRSDWEKDDLDLQKAASAPFRYDASVLDDIQPDGLYMLLGPRRSGKSVEMKKTISRLITKEHINPRRIIHFDCNGLDSKGLRRLVSIAREQHTATMTEPRYWFLDEITAITKGWPGAIAWMRKNLPGFGTDCVVVTGSSSRDLDAARKLLVGVHGHVSRTERFLFPMSFRQFGRVTGHSDIPLPDPIPARRWNTDEARSAVQEFLPWLDELDNTWMNYCQIGGYPQAVASYMTDGVIDPLFLQDLWDVIHGDALLRSSLTVTPTQTNLLLANIASRLTQPMVLRTLAQEVGYASHETAAARIDAMDASYLTWRCYPTQDKRWFPAKGSQYKTYFTDPLLARLMALRNPGAFDPPIGAITEQELGHHLLRQYATEQAGALSAFTDMVSIRTPTDNEIDFAASWTEGVAFEGKYIDDSLQRESQTARAQVQSGRIRAAVLATRMAYNLEGPVWAVPAGILTWLLSY